LPVRLANYEAALEASADAGAAIALPPRSLERT
jgi:hypothetical protein